MSERQETADAIIAEMRIFKCRNMGTGELELCNAIANYFADRLDAANKREYAMQKSVIDNLTKALKGTVEGLAWIYDREGYGYGTDAAYAAGCAVLDLLGVEYKKEGDAK